MSSLHGITYQLALDGIGLPRHDRSTSYDRKADMTNLAQSRLLAPEVPGSRSVELMGLDMLEEAFGRCKP